MDMKLAVLTLGVCGAMALCAAESLATSAEFTANLDTYVPHAVTASGGKSLTYIGSDTITSTSPAGTAGTILSKADASGTITWTPDAGGVWTLVNSHQGSTTLTVRYGIFGARGAGTDADPAKIVDDEELVDIGAASGYVFKPCGIDTLLDTLMLPSGIVLAQQSAGTYMLASSVAGELYTSAPVTAFFDTETPGPDRKVYLNEAVPVAFSGDRWQMPSSSTPSTLTYAPPSGASSSQACAGWGTATFSPDREGVWTLTLDGAETLAASILVRGKGLQVIFR